MQDCRLSKDVRDERTGWLWQYWGEKYPKREKNTQTEGIRITGEDTGANYARTMLMDLSSGEVRIRTVGKSERII